MNELHVHLLAETKRQRLDIETRLRRAYPTPLNEQSPELQSLGLLGAFAPTSAPRVNALAAYSAPEPVNSLLAAALRRG